MALARASARAGLKPKASHAHVYPLSRLVGVCPPVTLGGHGHSSQSRSSPLVAALLLVSPTLGSLIPHTVDCSLLHLSEPLSGCPFRRLFSCLSSPIPSVLVGTQYVYVPLAYGSGSASGDGASPYPSKSRFFPRAPAALFLSRFFFGCFAPMRHTMVVLTLAQSRFLVALFSGSFLFSLLSSLSRIAEDSPCVPLAYSLCLATIFLSVTIA